MSAELEQFKNFASTFFLWINEHPESQKFTFNLGDPTHHYTIRIWNDTKELDLHKTNESLGRDHSDYYETLFRIKFYSIGRILVMLKRMDLENSIKGFLKSKITVGKLNKYKCILIPMDSKSPTFQNAYKEKKKKNGKKIRFNTEFDFLTALTQITPEEGLINKADCFMVFRYKKGRWIKNGFLYRFIGTGVHGERSYIYFSPKIFRGLLKSFGLFFNDIANKLEFYNKEKIMSFFNETAILHKKVSKKE